MGKVSQTGLGSSGGLSMDRAWDKPPGQKPTPAAMQKAPEAGSSSGSGNGSPGRALKRQSEGMGCRKCN